MYQALYRAYRPKKFSDVAGQSHVTTSLRNTIINNKLSHAYLFNGPRGTGKTSMAKLFAKALSCEHPVNGEPCCECSACLAIEETQVQDIIEIDAASNNGVDEIRQLRDAVKYAPTQLKYKVYIIDEVHMLSIGAFNALLKTLEEPPAHIIFILATTEVHKIPATVISRCQRYDFHRISEKDIAKRISYVAEQENIKISSDAVSLVAKLADGALRDALGLLDQVNAYTSNEINIDDIYQVAGIVPKEMIINCLKYLMTNNSKELLTYFDYVFDHGKNINLFLQEIIEFLRDILIAKINNEIIDGAEEIIPLLDNEIIYQLIQILNDCLNDIKYARLPKITIQVALLKCANLFIDMNYNMEVSESPVSKTESEEQYTIPYLNDEIISQEIIEEVNEPIIHDYNDNNSVIEIEHSEADFLVEEETDNADEDFNMQSHAENEDGLDISPSNETNSQGINVEADWAIDDEQQEADEYTGGSQEELIVTNEETSEFQEQTDGLFVDDEILETHSKQPSVESEAVISNVVEDFQAIEGVSDLQVSIESQPELIVDELFTNDEVDNIVEPLASNSEDLEVNNLLSEPLAEEPNESLIDSGNDQSNEYYRSENNITEVLGVDTTIEAAIEYQQVVDSVEQEQVDIVFDFQGTQENKESRGMIPKYMEMIYSGNDDDEVEFQNYIGKHLQKIMAEVALQPEISKLDLFKRKWQVIEKDALNPIKSMLADTEPKIATNSEVVVSSYNKALVSQLRSRPSQQRVLDSIKDIVGETYNVIVIDEATWMKQREVFAQKWKRQEVNQEQVDVLSKEIEYVENDYDPDYVIEGQISLLDESEDSIVSDAKALFGDDIVEVK